MKISYTPRVSIGLPVYNGENYLVKALNSLLSQTFTDFELIISDNASTDATSDICHDLAAKDQRIRYYRSEVNRGAAWNYNNTFNLSKGEYFKWAAHDDLHHPTFLEKCVDILDHYPSVVLCFTKSAFIDHNDQEIKVYKHPFDLSIISRRKRFFNYACTGHIVHEIFGVIRAGILRKTPLIAGYWGSDLVLLGKLSLYGPFYQVTECLFKHREHKERSMINPQGAANFTQWFDSSKTGKFVLPHWRRLFENSKSVMFHPMDFSEKVGCWLELCRAVSRKRRKLTGEIFQIMKYAWKRY